MNFSQALAIVEHHPIAKSHLCRMLRFMLRIWFVFEFIFTSTCTAFLSVQPYSDSTSANVHITIHTHLIFIFAEISSHVRNEMNHKVLFLYAQVFHPLSVQVFLC